MSKPTAFWRLLLVCTSKKRSYDFVYLLYTQEKVIDHILTHVAAFIPERMGKLSLLLEPKIGNIAVKNDSITVFIASYHN